MDDDFVTKNLAKTPLVDEEFMEEINERKVVDGRK